METDANVLTQAEKTITELVSFIKDFRDNPKHLAEGFHTGFRKGTDERGAMAVWDAIHNSGNALVDATRYAINPYFTMWGGNKVLKEAESTLEEIRQARQNV